MRQTAPRLYGMPRALKKRFYLLHLLQKQYAALIGVAWVVCLLKNACGMVNCARFALYLQKV